MTRFRTDTDGDGTPDVIDDNNEESKLDLTDTFVGDTERDAETEREIELTDDGDLVDRRTTTESVGWDDGSELRDETVRERTIEDDGDTTDRVERRETDVNAEGETSEDLRVYEEGTQDGEDFAFSAHTTRDTDDDGSFEERSRTSQEWADGTSLETESERSLDDDGTLREEVKERAEFDDGTVRETATERTTEEDGRVRESIDETTEFEDGTRSEVDTDRETNEEGETHTTVHHLDSGVDEEGAKWTREWDEERYTDAEGNEISAEEFATPEAEEGQLTDGDRPLLDFDWAAAPSLGGDGPGGDGFQLAELDQPLTFNLDQDDAPRIHLPQDFMDNWREEHQQDDQQQEDYQYDEYGQN